jgi:hypothetical protein
MGESNVTEIVPRRHQARRRSGNSAGIVRLYGGIKPRKAALEET